MARVSFRGLGGVRRNHRYRNKNATFRTTSATSVAGGGPWQQSGLQRDESLVDQLVDLDPLAQRPLAAAERPLPGNSVFADPRLMRGGLNPLDQLADLLPEGVWLYAQIRLEDDEKISVVLLPAEPRARQQPERLHDQSETKSLISAKGQEC